AFTVQPVVTVEDAFGNIVSSGYTTPIALTISNGTLTCTGGNAATPSGGAATFGGCHGSVWGSGDTLTATSGSLTPTTSANFNITDVASQLVFTTQPVAGPSGAAFTTQPVVTVEDSAGRVVTSSTTAITLSSQVGGTQTQGGTLTLCTSLTPNAGVVTVATCNFAGTVGTSYTLKATSGALSTTSASFSPSGAGAPTQLVFTTDPVAGASGSPFTTQPVIKIEDSGGNVVTTSPATVTLALVGGPPGTLALCANLAAVAGVVNVSNCTFTGLVGTQYNLSASAGTLTADTSGNFTPSGPGPASQILLSGCSSNVVSATTCTLSAIVEDVTGNVETADASLLTFAKVSGTGSVTGLKGVAAVAGHASDVVTGVNIGAAVVNVTGEGLTSLSVTVTITPIPQTITWTAPGAKTWVPGGAGTFSLGSASDTSGSAVTFASSTPSICSVSGTTATMLTAGTCTITPTAAAQGNYALTVGTPSNITINKATQVTLVVTVSSDTYPYSISLANTGGSGTGAVTFSVVGGSASNCLIIGNTLTAASYGTCNVTATQAADNNYSSATSAAATETFNQATQVTLVVTVSSDTYPYSISLANTGGSGTGAV
ncbi:MAG TPA: hypothetical protein VII84_01705, partial [Acidimicrobiales bacterium]